MLIIEFLGAPCSGKSQISHELGVLLRQQGKSVWEKQYVLSHSGNRYKRVFAKLTKALKMCLLHPKLSLKTLQVLGNKTSWLNYLDIIGTVAKADVVIFEQGLCQCVGSLFDNEQPKEESVKGIMDALLMQTCDRIQVYVSVKKETVIKRMEKREDKPFYAACGDVMNAVELSIATAEVLCNCWKKKYGDAALITVTNDKDGESMAAAKVLLDTLKGNGLI